MKKKQNLIVALAALLLVMPLWTGAEQAAATEINILPYFVVGSVGDSWTYTFIAPSGVPDFTANLTKVTSGLLTGKFRIGNFVDIIDTPHLQYRIFDSNASGINIYETEGASFSPPITINALQPLDTVTANPFPGADDLWYFQKLPSLKVVAGTFDNVLVQLSLDKEFGPTSANTEFGLDPSIPYGVTHVSWMAAGIGEIQERDYNDLGTMLFEFQLKATSVVIPSAVPLPTPLVMLGSGLLGLIGWRKWTGS